MTNSPGHINDVLKKVMTHAEMLEELEDIQVILENENFPLCKYTLGLIIDSLRVRVEAERNCNHAFSNIRQPDRTTLTICMLCGHKKDKDHA